VSNNIRK